MNVLCVHISLAIDDIFNPSQALPLKMSGSDPKLREKNLSLINIDSKVNIANLLQI